MAVRVQPRQRKLPRGSRIDAVLPGVWGWRKPIHACGGAGQPQIRLVVQPTVHHLRAAGSREVGQSNCGRRTTSCPIVESVRTEATKDGRFGVSALRAPVGNGGRHGGRLRAMCLR